MAYFPLFVDIRGKDVLVAGGGAVAARRVESLLSVSYTHLDVYKRQCPDRGRGLPDHYCVGAG